MRAGSKNKFYIFKYAKLLQLKKKLSTYRAPVPFGASGASGPAAT